MKKKFTVVQIIPSLVSGGIEKVVVETNAALVKEGIKSLVISAGGKMVHAINQAGGEHIHMPVDTKNPITMFRNAKRIARIIASHDVDVVNAMSRAPAWSAFWACRKVSSCKLVTTIHGAYSLGSALMRPLKRFYNSSMVRGDMVVTVSRYIKDYAADNYKLFRKKVSEGKTRIIYGGVDVGLFNPDRVSVERIVALQKSMGLPDGRVVIAVPGRLSGAKGQMYAVEMLARLKNKDWFCVFMGDDKGHQNYRRRLKNRIKELGLSGNIRMEGDVSDMAAAYMLSDIVISASTKGEAFGRVVPEGQAMRKSVIATNTGATPEIITDGENGWLVPADDAEEFARVVDSVLDMSVEERMKIGEAARRHVMENFTVKMMTDKTIRAYRDVAEFPVEPHE